MIGFSENQTVEITKEFFKLTLLNLLIAISEIMRLIYRTKKD